jgi:membrane-bound metal-dependent hydrolase YbcI (DUF457 family)
MDGRTHFAVGSIVAIGISFVDANIGIIAGCMAGSLVPDIDSPESTINNKFLPAGFIWQKMNKYSFYLGKHAHNGLKHRGFILHSAWTVVAFLVLAIITQSGLCLGLAIGVLSHHILDMLTPAGLMWLYPRKITFIKFKK